MNKNLQHLAATERNFTTESTEGNFTHRGTEGTKLGEDKKIGALVRGNSRDGSFRPAQLFPRLPATVHPKFGSYKCRF